MTQPTSVLKQSDPNLCTLNLGNLSKQKTDYAISHDELGVTCRSAPPHEWFFLFSITGFQTLRQVIKDIHLLNDSCLMRPLLFIIRLHFTSLYIFYFELLPTLFCAREVAPVHSNARARVQVLSAGINLLSPDQGDAAPPEAMENI